MNEHELMGGRRLGAVWLAAATLATPAAVLWSAGLAQATDGSPATKPASASGPATPAGPVGDSPYLSPRRYSDKLNGFTLRPPADAELIKEPSSACVARWIAHDPKTAAVVRTVGVNVAVEKDPNIDIRKYALALVELLKTSADANLGSNAPHVFDEVENALLTRVDGKDAVDIRGTTGTENRIWRRQVWVMGQPGRFLIFWIAGPLSDRDKLDAILTDVVGQVKIVDPLEVLKAQEQNLLRGRLFLADLAKRRLAPAEKIQWFAFRLDGKIVGWTAQSESLISRGTQSGLEIQTATMLHLPKDEIRLAKRVLFTNSQGVDQWRETLQVGEKSAAVLTQEEGLRQGNLVNCTITTDKGLQKRSKKVPYDPNDPPDMYLPRAISILLPRLIDLKKPASYSFAVYASVDNSFKLRTFTVRGPEKINVGGKPVEAVHLTDSEEASDEVSSDIWVDAQGMALRIQSPGWPIIEACTREEIVTGMPESAKYVQEASGGK